MYKSIILLNLTHIYFLLNLGGKSSEKEDITYCALPLTFKSPKDLDRGLFQETDNKAIIECLLVYCNFCLLSLFLSQTYQGINYIYYNLSHLDV